MSSQLVAFSPMGVGILGLLLALFFYVKVKALPGGNETMARISSYIRQGAMAFVWRQNKVLLIYCLIVGGLIYVGFNFSVLAGLSFVFGAFLSLFAGYIGMKAATFANERTAQSARSKDKAKALVVALDGGAVMGLSVASLGLLGMGFLYYFFAHVPDFSTLIHSFAVGASSIALFARIGGGIYTKAADVGSDIAGKVIENIPEDDPRNPGVIADNVGDNVGDVAGMGADIYESMIASIVATMAIALTASSATMPILSTSMGATFETHQFAGILLPLVLSTLGLLVSIFTIFAVRQMKKMSPALVLRAALIIPPIALVLLSLVLMPMLEISQAVTWCLAVGAVGGAMIGLVTDYYTSASPIRKIAQSSLTGAGTNLIRGLAVGMESVSIPLILIAIIAFISDHFLGLYGISLAAVGMLAGTAVVMTVDAYGPISDNAGGISEMAGLGPEVRAITDELDSVGNTTAAIGKGFAIGSATLTVISLFAAYNAEVGHGRLLAGLPEMDLTITQANILIGILIGAILPYMVASSTMVAVGKAGGAIVEEIRRQFREIPGLMAGTGEPQPEKIVDIATKSALTEMIVPGLIAVVAPTLVGFLLGPETLAGLLVGSLAVGSTMALFMANAGGAWDNAKKNIEKGALEGHGKGSEAHKASVVGDMVGDPFKDTSGPAVAILIKVMSVVSLLIAPLIATR